MLSFAYFGDIHCACAVSTIFLLPFYNLTSLWIKRTLFL